MVYKGISVKEKNKARFDQIQRDESATNKRNIDQNEIMTLLLDLYEQVNVTKTLKVNPQ
jgi:rhamnogalacturonyl hydrolase YesR